MYTNNQFKEMEKNIGSIDFIKSAISTINKLLVHKNLVTEDELKQLFTNELTLSVIDSTNNKLNSSTSVEEPKLCKYCETEPCDCGNLDNTNPPEQFVQPPNQAVSLTPYEWHILLEELERSFQICNRDHENALMIYENISSQLNGGHKVTMTLRKE